MSKLIILGSANAVSDAQHENTHMVLEGDEQVVLIDCVGSPVRRLQKAGLEINQITDIIITHFHPDHVSALPLLLMDMWLTGRKAGINIYGLAHTLDRLAKLMDFYDWGSWPHFFTVDFHRLPQEEMAPVLDGPEFRIFSSPVHHLIPAVGLRVEALATQAVMAYSCDTEPCAEVVRLGMGADFLIHESSGMTLGHSSASQAGEIARQAEVGHLYLIHYPTGAFDPSSLVPEAQAIFGGPVSLAEDFMEIDL